MLSRPRKSSALGYIEHHQSPNPKVPRAINRCTLYIACPIGGCKQKKRQWKCIECHSLIEYGVTDNNYYCACGRITIDTCNYRCNKHELKQADASRLRESLSQLKQPRDYNILLLGETGVGKSTFINAFANYSSYATLDDAMNGSLITPIYNELKVTDENMKVITVTNGTPTGDEETAPGQPAAKKTEVHRFSFKKKVIRMIDTPGIGDARGAARDDENFKDILNTIASYPELHAIMILLRPNSARRALKFRYCIEEILRHLSKSARENIVFGFTNSRGTDFGDGGTKSVLIKHLEAISAEIKITSDKVYYFDSEGYSFLGEHFHGWKKSEERVNIYRKSWTHSVKETKRLLEHVTKLEPHRTQETLALNHTRLLICQLTKPMAEIAKMSELVTYKLEDKVEKTEDPWVSEKLRRHASLKHLTKLSVGGMTKALKGLEDERLIIEKAAARFGAFLEHNAIIAYSDARLEYLQCLIDEEKKKQPQFRDQALLAAFLEALRNHQVEVELLKVSMANGKNMDLLQITEIQGSVHQLCGLKHSGETLQKLRNTDDQASIACPREQDHIFTHVASRSSLLNTLDAASFRGRCHAPRSLSNSLLSLWSRINRK